jgi:hypothetical protein
MMSMFYAMYNSSSWWYNIYIYTYILYTKLGVQRWYNDTIIKCILRHTKAMIQATAYGMMDLTHKSMMDVQRHRTGATTDPDGSENTKWPGASNTDTSWVFLPHVCWKMRVSIHQQFLLLPSFY